MFSHARLSVLFIFSNV